MTQLGTAGPFSVRTIDLGRPGELDDVARNTLESHFETIPESRGRTDLQNMTFETMRTMLASAFAKPDRCCLVVVDGAGNVIGQRILVVKVDGEGRRFGEGWNLFVKAEYRKLGVASQLMQRADIWFRAQQVEYLETGTHVNNEKMKSLYQKEGYIFARNDHNGTNAVYVVKKFL